MAKRKASRRKINRNPFLGLLGIFLLIGISIVATVYLIFLRPGTVPTKPLTAPVVENHLPQIPTVAQAKEQKPEMSTAQIEEPVDLPTEPLDTAQVTDTEVETETAPATEIDRPAQPPEEAKPRVALIIDDIGYKKKLAKSFIDLDLNLNFSILPSSPHGQELSQYAHEKGKDLLLHLPMEATAKKWHPGPGALLLNMNKSQTTETIRKDLDFLPMAVGINNHMGSLYTENEEAMTLFLSEIKGKDLFFLDSLTSAKSVGFKIAQGLGIKTAKRNIFLDNDKDVTKIINQLESLIKIAEKHGQAIGIGHPYSSTLEALTTSKTLLDERVVLVPIHELVN